MADTPVHRLQREFAGLIAYLDSGAEASLRTTAQDSFRKALLLAAASHFEHRIVSTIEAFVRDSSGQNRLVTEFLKRKALSKQYHTLFAWDAPNANQFFALFGDEFKRFMQEKTRVNESLDAAVSAFLELGNERNRLVHTDYATFALEKTAEEIYASYLTALPFVEQLRGWLDECATQITAGQAA